VSASWDGRVAYSEADALPGAYYVTARDETGRTAYLVGPFVQPKPGQGAHAQALGLLRKARRHVQQHYARSMGWTFGTARVSRFNRLPDGVLNRALGVRP
jgi:hypothetical protein